MSVLTMLASAMAVCRYGLTGAAQPPDTKTCKAFHIGEADPHLDSGEGL